MKTVCLNKFEQISFSCVSVCANKLSEKKLRKNTRHIIPISFSINGILKQTGADKLYQQIKILQH